MITVGSRAISAPPVYKCCLVFLVSSPRCGLVLWLFRALLGVLGLCGSLPDWWCTIHLCEAPLEFPELSYCVLLILCIIRLFYAHFNSFTHKIYAFCRAGDRKQIGSSTQGIPHKWGKRNYAACCLISFYYPAHIPLNPAADSLMLGINHRFLNILIFLLSFLAGTANCVCRLFEKCKVYSFKLNWENGKIEKTIRRWLAHWKPRVDVIQWSMW